jgi:hypothetical protein
VKQRNHPSVPKVQPPSLLKRDCGALHLDSSTSSEWQSKIALKLFRPMYSQCWDEKTLYCYTLFRRVSPLVGTPCCGEECLLVQKISPRATLGRNDDYKHVRWPNSSVNVLHKTLPSRSRFSNVPPSLCKGRLNCGEDLWNKEITRLYQRLLSSAVRTTAASVTVRACICAHSSRATKTVHCTVLIMWHLSHFVKEGLRRVAPRFFGKPQNDKVRISAFCRIIK